VAGGREGFSATLFYTTIYAITLVGAFAVVGMVKSETGGDDLQNFAGLGSRSPLAAACMSIFMLSLAGLPPLAGFFGKFYLFSVAFQAGGNHGLLWLVIVALFGSFVSLYYYLIVLRAIFVDKESVPDTRHTSHFVATATMAVLAAAVLLLGVMPQALVARVIASLP
jgi:NADH-quinone oxidoreductase subunit N